MESHKTIYGDLRGLAALLAVCGSAGCGSSDPSDVPNHFEASQDELRDRVKPKAPTNLRIAGNTSYTVSLAWNPSTARTPSQSSRRIRRAMFPRRQR